MTKTILVVEDTIDNFFLVEAVLQPLGHTIIHAKDGDVGLEKVQDIIPDLVLVDMRMPGMDGWSLARAIRADADTAHIPIIALAVPVDKTDEKAALDAGCNLYVPKPFRPQVLRDAVQRFI